MVVLVALREEPVPMLTRWRSHRAALLDRHCDAEEIERLRWAWREACAGAGIGRTTPTVTGPTTTTPAVVSVVLGPPTVLMVRLLPGQLVADIQRAAGRLAGHLGAVALRVEPRGLEWARVELLTVDPLAETLPYRALPARIGNGGLVLLGRDEGGHDHISTVAELPHIAVQGQTRSGKTAWMYALLATLTPQDDVVIAGVDPSGLLLRPFIGSRHADWQAVGLADLGRVEAVLAQLVAEMDQRIATMPVYRDTLPTSRACPLLVVVLEEWPATLRALDAADVKAGKRVRALTARLLAESHKTGMRVVMIAQRMEATIVGGAERAQLAGRLSFRSDNVESVRLLHPGVDADTAAAHAEAPDGVALLSAPGVSLRRIRGPWVGGYVRFVDLVTAPQHP